MADQTTDYKPPKSREELLRRYASGERTFPDTDLSDANLAGITLDGRQLWEVLLVFDANFEEASLRGTSFRECNVKCANFRHADLTGHRLNSRLSNWRNSEGAVLEGANFVGAGYYGYTIQEGDQFPPTQE